MAAPIAATSQLRKRGSRIALDDFGGGRSSLRLWSELKPEIVKIDKYFSCELHGRRPCTSFADLAPRLVEMHNGLDELTQVLTSEDQRHLADGFLIVENGHCRGLGSGKQLVRVVTEARTEAARHANPLTLLPGGQARCRSVIAAFNQSAIALFDAQARADGGLHAEDRHGVLRFHPLTTLRIGAVVVDTGQVARAEDVAGAAALAKRRAKSAASGLRVRGSAPA